jgi:hypothetical protein
VQLLTSKLKAWRTKPHLKVGEDVTDRCSYSFPPFTLTHQTPSFISSLILFARLRSLFHFFFSIFSPRRLRLSFRLCLSFLFFPCSASCFTLRTTALQGKLTHAVHSRAIDVASLHLACRALAHCICCSPLFEQLHCKSIHSSLFSSSSLPIVPAKRVRRALFQWFRVYFTFVF